MGQVTLFLNSGLFRYNSVIVETSNRLISNHVAKKLGLILFISACQLKTMASIPPSAFSAGRIRQTQRDDREMKLSKPSKGNEPTKSFNTSCKLLLM